MKKDNKNYQKNTNDCNTTDDNSKKTEEETKIG